MRLSYFTKKLQFLKIQKRTRYERMYQLPYVVLLSRAYRGIFWSTNRLTEGRIYIYIYVYRNFIKYLLFFLFEYTICITLNKVFVHLCHILVLYIYISDDHQAPGYFYYQQSRPSRPICTVLKKIPTQIVGMTAYNGYQLATRLPTVGRWDKYNHQGSALILFSLWPFLMPVFSHNFPSIPFFSIKIF